MVDRLWETAGKHVGLTTIDGQTVSTVHLIFDHGVSGHPRLYETMIFNELSGDFLSFQMRYATRDQALRGHKLVVAMLNNDDFVFIEDVAFDVIVVEYAEILGHFATTTGDEHENASDQP